MDWLTDLDLGKSTHGRDVYLGAMAVVLMMAGIATAGTIVTTDHIVSSTYGVDGTLVAIDVPTPTVFPYVGDGDPIWVGDPNVIATTADNGFQILVGSGIQSEQYGDSNWEPDGTPFGESKNWGAYGGPDSILGFNFNLAACGIDVPDGTVIHAVYHTWDTRGKDNADFSWSETTSGTTNVAYYRAVQADLVLNWMDDQGTNRMGNFQRIITGPIVVNGGDGFIVLQNRNPNTAHLDAVVIDAGLSPPVPTGSILSIK